MLILLGRPRFLSPILPVTGYLAISGLVNLEQLLILEMAAVNAVTARARGRKKFEAGTW